MPTAAAFLLLLSLAICAAGEPALAPTYSKDVAPILYKNCTGCHRPNDIAPMSLLTYKEARPWAAAIRQAVATRTMPPWHADPQFGHFANDPRLSEADIATLVAWAKAGAPEGNRADLPAAPQYSDGDWKLGTPDLVVDIGQDHHIDNRAVADEYTYFTVDPHITEDTWVKAVELRPGNKRVVHHAHVWVEQPNGEKTAGPQLIYKDKFGLTRIKEDAPVLNNGCLSEDGGNLPGRKLNDGDGPLGSYLPGKAPDVYPAGTAKLVRAGSRLKFQVHYNNTLNAPQTDRTSVGLIFASAAPEHPLHRVDSSAYLFAIPPGQAGVEVSNCTTFQKDVRLLSYVAHMHYRGQDMRFEIEHADKRRETLLFVPHYSFAWQQIYRVREPVAVEKGARLIVTAHFDNSANNKWNPDPTKTVRWGEPSSSEMMDGWVEYVDATPAPLVSAAELRK